MEFTQDVKEDALDNAIALAEGYIESEDKAEGWDEHNIREKYVQQLEYLRSLRAAL